MNKRTGILFLIVASVLGVITFSTIIGTSNAFKDNDKKTYETTLNIITKQAELYGAKSEALKNDGNLVITVNDLVDAGYLVSDNDKGEILDPRNEKITLNGLKVKLSYENEEVKAEVIEDN